MDDLNCSLMVLAFVLGSVLTFALMIRRVNREVPVSASVGATDSKKSDSESQDETSKTPTDEEK